MGDAPQACEFATLLAHRVSCCFAFLCFQTFLACAAVHPLIERQLRACVGTCMDASTDAHGCVSLYSGLEYQALCRAASSLPRVRPKRLMRGCISAWALESS